MTKSSPINCMQCVHFYITWDAKFPRGCKAYGFKTQALPSQAVLSSSGKPCLQFAPKMPVKPGK
nr:uracil-DNA glycosylase [Paenibacillus ferrarius]